MHVLPVPKHPNSSEPVELLIADFTFNMVAEIIQPRPHTAKATGEVAWSGLAV